ncbi:MAG: IS3 family transposase [Streptococcaceae bacterium]|nr:IS3 family transposase [Streptococcaceae bacterium]
MAKSSMKARKEIHIKRIYADSKGIYGAPKIHKKLMNEGRKVML